MVGVGWGLSICMSDELPGDTVLPVGTAGLLKRPVSSANGPFPPLAENGEQMHHPSATNPPKPYSALRPPCQRHGRDQVALGEEAVIGGPSRSARGPRDHSRPPPGGVAGVSPRAAGRGADLSAPQLCLARSSFLTCILEGAGLGSRHAPPLIRCGVHVGPTSDSKVYKHTRNVS